MRKHFLNVNSYTTVLSYNSMPKNPIIIYYLNSW